METESGGDWHRIHSEVYLGEQTARGYHRDHLGVRNGGIEVAEAVYAVCSRNLPVASADAMTGFTTIRGSTW